MAQEGGIHIGFCEKPIYNFIFIKFNFTFFILGMMLGKNFPCYQTTEVGDTTAFPYSIGTKYVIVFLSSKVTCLCLHRGRNSIKSFRNGCKRKEKGKYKTVNDFRKQCRIPNFQYEKFLTSSTIFYHLIGLSCDSHLLTVA